MKYIDSLTKSSGLRAADFERMNNSSSIFWNTNVVDDFSHTFKKLFIEAWYETALDP